MLLDKRFKGGIALDQIPRPVSSNSSSRNNSISSVDDLPPVPTHTPIILKSAMSRPQRPIPPAPASKPNWTPPPAPPSVSTKPPGWKISMGNPIAPSLENNIITAKPTIPLPSLTQNVFPQAMTITPKELTKLLLKKDNPPSVLLLDVRPREVFKRGCVKHKWLVQLEPLVLRRE